MMWSILGFIVWALLFTALGIGIMGAVAVSSRRSECEECEYRKYYYEVEDHTWIE